MKEMKGIAKLLFGIFLILFAIFIHSIGSSTEFMVLAIGIGFVALVVSVMGILQS